MIRVVVFDVGETLVDETRIWTRWAERLGVTPFTMHGVLGGMAALDRSHREAFEVVRPGIDIGAEIEAWRRDDPDGLRENFDADDLYPDVRPGLASLRDAGYQVIIAGNQPVQAYDALTAMDLPVDAVYTSAGWSVTKPHPAFFGKVAAAAGCPPEEILYVGDRLDNDILPGRQAGMRTALIRRGPWGHLHATRPTASAADLIVDTIPDITIALVEDRL
ncbi:HAD family hydrolase [Sphaerisporangium rubeum]|uniref:HAD superfamily hydrolase (TIGR01662 family) n=1 Tax=Sphaerisporangium rubeum TaxID=321317 RepID=A0A7X0IDV4_9ACTN|nr:HAD superfamily hydrolase (TIGR01662 family) [Sphaerisporangium rubeum]